MIAAVRLAACAALALAPLAAAYAQTPAATIDSAAPEPGADSDDIVVVGDNGESYRLTADALRDAARAYSANRARFAPASRLLFAVEAANGGSLDGIAIYLRAKRRNRDGERTIVDLPLDADNRIALPIDLVASGDYDLGANRSRGGIRIRPLVLTSPSTLTDRRFGDLRLQCRVSLAFARLSLPIRMLAGAIGPCGSSRVALYARAPQPVAGVAISGYGQPIDIRPDGLAFRVPLHDAAIGNDARLRVTYR